MTEIQRIRILIADDHQPFRQSLARLIGSQPDMVVVDQAADGAEALEKIRGGGHDVAILDITMPVKNGLEVLGEARREFPSLPVIMLSIHPPGAYQVRAMSIGAAGYVTKETAAEKLLDEVRRVARRS